MNNYDIDSSDLPVDNVQIKASFEFNVSCDNKIVFPVWMQLDLFEDEEFDMLVEIYLIQTPYPISSDSKIIVRNLDQNVYKILLAADYIDSEEY